MFDLPDPLGFTAGRRISASGLKVISLAQSPGAAVGDVESALHADASLCGRFLELVNSPLFGLQRITQARHAVMVVGFGGVRSAILGLVLRDFMAGIACPGFAADGLFRHCLATAAAGRSLARSANADAGESEQVFAAGLLHDVGKLFVGGEGVVAASATPQSERHAYGTDHAALSRKACQEWGFDRSLSDLVAGHHERVDRRLTAAALRLGNEVAHETGIGYAPGAAPEPEFAREDQEVTRMLGDRWQRAAARAREAITAVMESFRLPAEGGRGG